jgi:acetate---CoA ligase (ADP-forming)
VAMLKAGRSQVGAEAAASHTGALAAADKVVDAALAQVGVVRVDDVTELLDVGEVMTLERPAGRRVAVVTTSGGSGILAADALEAEGLSLADLAPATTEALEQIVPAYGSTANPVDVTASVMSNSDLFDHTLDVIAEDPGVDAILATFCVLTGKDVDDVVTSLARVAARSGKPVLAARTGADHLAPDATSRMRAAGIPSYPTPARAVRALAALTRFGEWSRRRTVEDSGRLAGSTAPLPRAGASEQEIKDLFSAHDVPVPTGRMAHSARDAVVAVEECGGRAVFKAVVPGLVHKSDAGGVVLGVTQADAEQAYDKVVALGGEVWVEEMVPAGVEALVGFTTSPLGTVLTVGVGGVLTEVVGDVSLRVLPVTRADVEEMVDETRLGRLVAGVRGAPPADRGAFVDLVVHLAHLVQDWPAGFELDLNPVTVLPEGVRVLDAAYVAPNH